MTGYRLYTRLKHFLTAKHWRGAAIHSPMMYAFVRELVLPNHRKELIGAIRERYGAERVVVVERVGDLGRVAGKDVAILLKPFGNVHQKREFNMWYKGNHAIVAHLPGMIVLFFDPKLQKQYYKIRN